MSTSRVIRSVSSAAQGGGDLTYGLTGLAQILFGVGSSVLSSLPEYGMVLGIIDILKAANESYNVPRDPVTHTKSLIRALTSASLVDLSYECFSQGSTAFSWMCNGFAIKSVGELVISFITLLQARSKRDEIAAKFKPADSNFRSEHPAEDDGELLDAEEEYKKAWQKFVFNCFQALGWGLIALSKVAAMATIASPPVLFGLGALSLAAAGIYAMYNTYNTYSNDYEQQKANNSRSAPAPSRLLALKRSIFASPAPGAVAESDGSPLVVDAHRGSSHSSLDRPEDGERQDDHSPPRSRSNSA